MACYGVVWYGMMWCVWYDIVLHGMACYDVVWYILRYVVCMIWSSLVWYGMLWCGVVRYDLVCMVWYSLV